MKKTTCLSTVAVTLVLLSALPVQAQEPAAPKEPVRNTGAHCQGEGKPKVLFSDTLLGLVNPLGVEHQTSFSVCSPLIKTPGILFDYTRVETGVMNYLGPIYSHQGGFVNISPLSILDFHAEASTVYMWPIPMDGAGYYPLDSYKADISGSAMPASKGIDALGVNANFSTTLQAKIGVAPGLAIAVQESPGLSFWYLGKGPYYSNPREDATLARLDWVVKNTALALMEYSPYAPVTFRLGFQDELKYVPRSKYLGHIAGFLTSVVIKPMGPRLEIQPFLRATQYVSHRSLEGVMFLGGVNFYYALAG